MSTKFGQSGLCRSKIISSRNLRNLLGQISPTSGVRTLSYAASLILAKPFSRSLFICSPQCRANSDAAIPDLGNATTPALAALKGGLPTLEETPPPTIRLKGVRGLWHQSCLTKQGQGSPVERDAKLTSLAAWTILTKSCSTPTTTKNLPKHPGNIRKIIGFSS